MKYLFLVFVTCLSITSFSHAENFSPWSQQFLQFEIDAAYKHVQSNQLKTSHGTKNHHLRSDLLVASLAFSPTPTSDVAVALLANDTQKHDAGFEGARAFYKNQFQNDLVDDYFSMAFGLGATVGNPNRVKDLSSDLHSTASIDAFYSIGKEFWFTKLGLYRAFAAVDFGVPVNGSCWINPVLQIEYLYKKAHTFGAFLDFEKGFGNRSLKNSHHFPGWTHIDYHQTDVGLNYSYNLEGVGSVFAKVYYRIDAKNAAKDTKGFMIGLTIPFGI